MQKTPRATGMEKPIAKNITQLFLIVFSVVLGIFLSERIEEQKNKNEAAKLLSKVTSEVIENKKLVENWAPYHAQIARRLGSLSNDDLFVEQFINDKTVLYKEVLTEGTFMTRMPSSDAWDIAKSHPLIVNLDYDELLILSKIYNQQKSTFEPTDKISEIFFSSDFNSKETAKSNLQSFNNLMQEVASREMTLIDYYKEAEGIFNLQNE